MASPREVWRSPVFDRLGAAAYDFFVERERLAQLGGRLVWGTDASLLYKRLGVIADAPAGTRILDLPCGGGVAFRALRPEQDVDYVAADLSPGMLRRARRVAMERGLRQIRFVEADVERLPFDDASFDLCVCLNSLHCFPDPAAALKELARCLRPGGRLLGDSAVRGEGRRYDRLIELYGKRGVFGPGGSRADVERWLADAGFSETEIEVSGAVAHFSSRR